MPAETQNGDTPTGVSHKQISNMMRESLYWSRETMQIYQRTQLEQLLRHARQHVPFYMTRLAGLFDNQDRIDWTKWDDLPILTRAALRDNPELLKARENPPLHGPIYEASSSGSSGIPVTVTFPALFTHVANVAWQRFRSLHGVDFGTGFNDFRMKLPQHAGQGAEYCAPRENEPTFLILRQLPVQRKLQLLAQSPFKFLQDGPNHAEILARANLDLGKPVQLSVISAVGMPVSEEQRQLFADSFGAKTIEPYSSKEGSLIAFQCPHGPHFHVCEELLMLEVVDERGKPVAPGQQGRCIVTTLFNSAQPLIRYDQGDIVQYGNHCSGGITLAVIEKIIGRQDSVFRFTGGDTTLFGLDAAEIRKQLKADAFQCAQTGPDQLEVRYVAKHDVFENNKVAVERLIQAVAGFAISTRFRRVNDIPFNAGGKQQRFVNEYGDHR